MMAAKEPLTNRVLPVAVALLLAGAAAARTLEVGPGRPFATIAAAYAKADQGDVIKVHPQPDNAPYAAVAVYVDKPGVSFVAVPGKDGARVKLSGTGFDYNGVGRTPRAMFQFNPGADGCVLEGFELSGAHNASHNGAGVRINQANRITVRNCEIHHNDMGAMSNGGHDSGAEQLFENCVVHHNGDLTEPGYNHNFYLGGASVTLRACAVFSSLTGHNVKSRAHFNWIEFCYVHDSNNREFDLVDAAETAAPASHAVLLGNVIVKDPQCPGNRAVIHFGQDGGKEHDGTLYLVHNTIVTPFAAPVVDLDAPKAGARLLGNLVTDGGAGQNQQVLVNVSRGAAAQNVTTGANWVSAGFGAKLPAGDGNTVGRAGQQPPFADATKRDFRLTRTLAGVTGAGLVELAWQLPPAPGAKPAAPGAQPVPLLVWQYREPAGREPRPAARQADLGAYGRTK